MTYPFYIAHSIAGRTRIRWAGDTEEKAHIEELAANIVNIPGVNHAEPRITTGSIIIDHEDVEWSRLESKLTEMLPMQFIPAPAPVPYTGMDALSQGLDEVDNVLKSLNMDRNSLTLLLLSILIIVQAVRGQVLVPSASFIAFAFEILSQNRSDVSKSMGQANHSVVQNSVTQHQK